MTTTFRRQQSQGHRLRELVRRTGELYIATDRGVPRSTARGWLGASPIAVVSLNEADLTEQELRQKILTRQRRVDKLAALLRLALASTKLRAYARRRASAGRIRQSEDSARGRSPARASPARVLRFLHLSPSRFHAWAAGSARVRSTIRFRVPHVPAPTDARRGPRDRRHGGDLARLPSRADPYARGPRAASRHRLRLALDVVQPRADARLETATLRVHPAKPKVGLRTTRPDEMRHIDTTVIRLGDGTRAYNLHAVIDNFSRRILGWRVAAVFAAVNCVAVLLEASQHATDTERVPGSPVVLADAGAQNVNAQVDALIAAGALHRLLALTQLKFSNSMIEASWRSLKHHWLFLHSLDSVATVRRLVAFFVDEHNRVLLHSAFRGQTPDEMYFGMGRAIPAGTNVTRGRRAPSTPAGQPISVLRDVPGSQSERMTARRTLLRPLARRLLLVERYGRDKPTTPSYTWRTKSC